MVTRSAVDNRRLAQVLSELGATVIPVPLVAVLAPDDGGRALAAAVRNLADYRWVVLTSVNGVEAVRSALAGAPWPAEVLVAPVGPATAAAARSAGMAVGPVPETATAAALVDGFAPTGTARSGSGDTASSGGRDTASSGGRDTASGGRDTERDRPRIPGPPRVLAPLAELAGATVVDGLRAKGYRVDRVTAYRTAAPTGDADRSPDGGPDPASVAAADAVTFFSPSAVDRFVRRFGPEGAPETVVCIGPSTTERAASHGFERLVAASPHTEAGVVDALCSALATGRSTPAG